MKKIVSLNHFGKMLNSIEPTLNQSIINLRSNIQSADLKFITPYFLLHIKLMLLPSINGMILYLNALRPSASN